MDSLIGLLFLILPVLFSLVGKKLETAAKKGSEGGPQAESGGAVPGPTPAPAPAPAPAPVVRQQKTAKPYKVEEAVKPRKREAIDPKKLVIYSEIMKPKF